jgi:hypothetical protein
MDANASPREPLPGWWAVSLTSGLVCGVLPALIGLILTLAGDAVIGCGEFGDFGCGGYLVLGLYACPGSGVVGAFVGGLNAVRMSRARAGCTRSDVWKGSVALALLSLFVAVPVSLSILRSF